MGASIERLISKETESDLIKLGIYQVAGGAVGILIIIWSIYRSFLLTGLSVLIYLLVLLFFSYSIFCGILCLKAKKNALQHSLANQLLQVIGFALLGFAFRYAAGLFLSIGLDLTESIQLTFGAGISKFDFTLNIDADKLEVNFNVIPFAIIYWIDKLMKRVKEEAALRQIAALGEG